MLLSNCCTAEVSGALHEKLYTAITHTGVCPKCGQITSFVICCDNCRKNEDEIKIQTIDGTDLCVECRLDRSIHYSHKKRKGDQK